MDSGNQKIPATVTAVTGGYIYNNFDTETGFYVYSPETPDDAKSNVMTYAGRMNGGDLKWTFNNATDDYNSDVNLSLKVAIVNYQTKLVSIQNETVTGVKLLNRLDFDIFPNPIFERFYIISGISLISIEIYTMNGNLVYKEQSNKKDVNVDNLKSGLYLVKIVTKEGSMTKTIVKQ